MQSDAKCKMWNVQCKMDAKFEIQSGNIKYIKYIMNNFEVYSTKYKMENIQYRNKKYKI